MVNNRNIYLKLKLKYDGVKIEEFINLQQEIRGDVVPYDLYHLVMKNVESKGKNSKQNRRTVRSGRRAEIIKLLIASVIAVVMGFGISGTCISSLPNIFFQIENQKGENGVMTSTEREPDELIATEDEATVLFQKIYDKYNIKLPKLGYMPGDMEYDYYDLSTDNLFGVLVYKYQNRYMFHYEFDLIEANSSTGMYWDDEVKESYQFQVENHKIEVRRHEIAATKQTMMSAQFFVEDILCEMSCVIEQEEFDEILKKLIFSY